MDELNKFINLLLQAAVTALAPIVVAYVIATLRSLRDRARAELSTEQWAIVEAVVATVVSAAEQSGLANHISAEGRAKKEWAIAEAARILSRYGLSVNLDTISALIEAEVYRQLNAHKP